MNKKSTIIIPSYQNSSYLKLCIQSILKHSYFDHEIIVHLNSPDIESEIFLNKEKIFFTKSNKNIGLCSAVNHASTKSNTNFILYAHDDMYFLPKWDVFLFDEINLIPHNKFYLSLTQISHNRGVKGNLHHIHFDCGSDLKNFNEDKLLDNFERFEFRDLQGSHWAPHIIHKDTWKAIGGFSEEFNPGFGSDPDLNMKLWKYGVRIFKGISKSRVYHFGSLTARKNKNVFRNNGKMTFLIKWKMTVDFFTKHYLRRGTVYYEPLKEPEKNFSYYLDYIFSKIKFFITKYFVWKRN